jgi:hypothetical protein
MPSKKCAAVGSLSPPPCRLLLTIDMSSPARARSGSRNQVTRRRQERRQMSCVAPTCHCLKSQSRSRAINILPRRDQARSGHTDAARSGETYKKGRRTGNAGSQSSNRSWSELFTGARADLKAARKVVEAALFTPIHPRETLALIRRAAVSTRGIDSFRCR